MSNTDLSKQPFKYIKRTNEWVTLEDYHHYYLKNTDISHYGLSCGYVQKDSINKDNGEVYTVELYKECAVYHIKITLRDSEGLLVRLNNNIYPYMYHKVSTYSLTQARKVYRKSIAWCENQLDFPPEIITLDTLERACA